MSQLKSMTGFGIAQNQFDETHVSVQIRSWNRKGSDISIQLPSNYRDMEGVIREWLHAKVHRGSLQVHVDYKGSSRHSYLFDQLAWKKLIESVEVASQASDVSFKDLLLSVAGPWSHSMGCFQPAQVEADLEIVQKRLLMTLEKAYEEWEKFRIHEGEALCQTLSSLLDEISVILVPLQLAISSIAPRLTERLLKRLEAIGIYQHSDPTRWQMEVALIAERSDVREELDRLQMHVSHFRSCLKEGPFPVGRRLDFLSQEMVRETNTLMNKCQDFEVSQMGVDLKVAVDRLREQLQNVE